MGVVGAPKINAGQTLQGLCVLGAAVAIALFSARDHAGGWNDGSRLATVECLIDYHTLAIDNSIFVRVPVDSARPSPYPLNDPGLLLAGTGDKLFINGHFYSDKSPVPALLLAGAYQLYQWCTGCTAREHADSFCYVMTLASSGLAYVVAVWCIYQLAVCLRLPRSLQLLLTASFGLATVAPAYSRHVNNHMLLLGVLATLILGLARFANQAAVGAVCWGRQVYLGTLLGVAYTVDLGAGPIVGLCTLALIAYRCRHVVPVLALLLGALPWISLHHALNYAVGGTFKPANAVASYFDWPGCTFNAQNMTGGWHHASISDFLLYSVDMLVGRRGFLGHNLPLFLAVLAAPILLRRRRAEFPELIYALCCCGGAWLLYAATSNNYSGQCCSIRWFVPLLAPAYYVLALLVREQPRFLLGFLILSALGMVEGVLMWLQGPWMKHMLPFYWQWQCAAFLTIAICCHWLTRAKSAVLPGTEEQQAAAA